MAAKRRFIGFLVAPLISLGVVFGGTPVLAQEDSDPVPVADQSVPEWWNRTQVDWRMLPIVGFAYTNFCDTRSRALENNDTQLLQAVTAGEFLRGEVEFIDDMRNKGRAQHVEVEHHPQVWEAAADEAVVYDPYVDTSYDIDTHTQQPIDPRPAPERLYIAYRLQPVDGKWKVVDAIRIGNGEQLNNDDN